MSSSAALRLKIERALAARIPSALTPAPRTCQTASTGIPQVDELLDGGLPVGAISEITGATSSGRTSLALCFVAGRTREEQVCAWVDVDDALDPESAAASGVLLARLLWFRCRDRAAGSRGRPWSRLDQALRATDLLLQTAGFGAIVLDLGDTEPEHAGRIPLASWFRFRQAADRARTSLVVLGRDSCAHSAAEAVLACRACLACRPAGGRDGSPTVLDGLRFEVERQRQRTPQALPAKRPPAAAWSAGTAWEAGRRA